MSWSGACTGSGACVVTMDGDKTVTVNFIQNTVNILDAEMTEGDTTTVEMTFLATLPISPTASVRANYMTVAVSANAGLDYQTETGEVVFPAGDREVPITVSVLGDLLDEDDEILNLVLSSPVGGVIADGTGVGKILDNDAQPNLSISDVQVNEGNSGIVGAVFTVTLDAPSGRVVTLSYSTGGGTATANADYLSKFATPT